VSIPELPLGTVSPFTPMAVTREVRVVVRVPADANFRQTMEGFLVALRELRLGSTAWQALSPGEPESATPMPLFREVRQVSQVTRNDDFIYLDPYYRDPVTDTIQEVQRTVSRRVYVVTYLCSLGQGEAVGAESPQNPGGGTYGGDPYQDQAAPPGGDVDTEMFQ